MKKMTLLTIALAILAFSPLSYALAQTTGNTQTTVEEQLRDWARVKTPWVFTAPAASASAAAAATTSTTATTSTAVGSSSAAAAGTSECTVQKHLNNLNAVTDLYRGLVNAEPDSKILNFLASSLDSGALTIDQVKLAVMSSDEYKAAHPNGTETATTTDTTAVALQQNSTTNPADPATTELVPINNTAATTTPAATTTATTTDSSTAAAATTPAATTTDSTATTAASTAPAATATTTTADSSTAAAATTTSSSAAAPAATTTTSSSIADIGNQITSGTVAATGDSSTAAASSVASSSEVVAAATAAANVPTAEALMAIEKTRALCKKRVERVAGAALKFIQEKKAAEKFNTRKLVSCGYLVKDEIFCPECEKAGKTFNMTITSRHVVVRCSDHYLIATRVIPAATTEENKVESKPGDFARNAGNFVGDAYEKAGYAVAGKIGQNLAGLPAAGARIAGEVIGFEVDAAAAIGNFVAKAAGTVVKAELGLVQGGLNIIKSGAGFIADGIGSLRSKLPTF
ncbi:MAG TPA: hypothetical protein PKK26_02935 [Candidatus Wallbacteria bacterium]|nr:hypothetical protein [Candidatus Wallbacteria bacterium]